MLKNNTWLSFEQVSVAPVKRAGSVCTLSSPDSSVTSFDDPKEHKVVLEGDKSMSILSLYSQPDLGIDVQTQLRGCNLRSLCVCAVAIRSKSLVVHFDRCTKGFLQVWATESAEPQIHGMDVVSQDEGRIYQVELPGGLSVELDPLLTQVKVLSSKSSNLGTGGICVQNSSSLLATNSTAAEPHCTNNDQCPT